MKFRLYYANQLVDDIESEFIPLNTAASIRKLHGDEIFQGGYLFLYQNIGGWIRVEMLSDSRWYKPNFTPLLTSDVPKELLTLELIQG